MSGSVSGFVVKTIPTIPTPSVPLPKARPSGIENAEMPFTGAYGLF
jgi:hypothetical protein